MHIVRIFPFYLKKKIKTIFKYNHLIIINFDDLFIHSTQSLTLSSNFLLKENIHPIFVNQNSISKIKTRLYRILPLYNIHKSNLIHSRFYLHIKNSIRHIRDYPENSRSILKIKIIILEPPIIPLILSISLKISLSKPSKLSSPPFQIFQNSKEERKRKFHEPRIRHCVKSASPPGILVPGWKINAERKRDDEPRATISHVVHARRSSPVGIGKELKNCEGGASASRYTKSKEGSLDKPRVR